MLPVPLVLPHDSVETSVLTAMSHYSSDVISRTAVASLVEVATDAKLFSGSFHHSVTIVVVYKCREVSGRLVHQQPAVEIIPYNLLE